MSDRAQSRPLWRIPIRPYDQGWLLALGSALLFFAAPATAQRPHRDWDIGQEAVDFGANAVLGGITAGVFAWLGGRDISDAFLTGAGGGAVSYGGKRVATASFDGAGFLGREVASVGHSAITNARNGRPPLSQIWLPLGPIQLRTPGDGHDLGVQLDATNTVLLLFGILSPDLDLEWGATLSTGTPVFLADRDLRIFGGDADALTAAGIVILSNDLGEGRRRHTALRHETIHVIQNDMMRLNWSYPFEHEALGRRLKGDSFFQLGVSSVLLVQLLGGSGGLVEAEARHLDGR